MKKRSIILSLFISFAVIISYSFVINPDVPSNNSDETELINPTLDVNGNTCCPPGWDLRCRTPGVRNNISKDVNGDRCLCRKDLPGNNANGNNQGPVPARNWKDNNQPCGGN